jgi:protein SCO1
MTRLLALSLLLWAVALPPAQAQSSLTAHQLADLSFHQHPGAQLPLDAALVDERGNPVRLDQFFGAKPAVLVLDYLTCRTLCGFVLGGLATALAHVPLTPGNDFSVVAISIDPRDTPADAQHARAQYLARYGEPGASGWHFLTGSAAEVRRVADAVGFPYRYDPGIRQFAHPAGLVVVAPDARVARYILGIDYRPLDLRLALTEAGQGRISSPVTNLLLLCYCYNPTTGRYDASIAEAMQIAGGITVLGILGLVLRLSRPRKAG